MKGQQCYLDYVRGVIISKHGVDTHTDVFCLLATCRAKGERMGEFSNDKNRRACLVCHLKQKFMGFN